MRLTNFVLPGLDLDVISDAAKRAMCEVAASNLVPEAAKIESDPEMWAEDRDDLQDFARDNAGMELAARLQPLIPDSKIFSDQDYAAVADEDDLAAALSGKAVWLVDSLGGGGGFKYRDTGRPYGISVSLLIHGQPVFAAIHDPQNDVMIAAHEGRCVSQNDVPIERFNNMPAREQVVALGAGYGTDAAASRAVQECFANSFAVDSDSPAMAFQEICRQQFDGYAASTVAPHKHVPGLYLAQRLGMYARMMNGQNPAPSCAGDGIIVAPNKESWIELYAALTGGQRAPKLAEDKAAPRMGMKSIPVGISVN